MENEIWKDIPGYDGYYQVSSYGNVRSLERPYTYGTRQERISKNRKRKVLQYSSEGEYIAKYDGAIDAENATGIKRQNISKVILGKRHTAGGYIWKKGGSK